MRVAIVGAGLAGLTTARTLADRGAVVSVFDKGRVVGGRLATQGREQGGFDHGAQRFSARSDGFVEVVSSWCARDLVRAADTWWVPVRSTNALAQALAVGLAVRTSARVTRLSRRSRAWWLSIEGAEDEGPFEVVLLTAPAPQSAALLSPHRLFVDELAAIRFDPTWSLALTCDAESARFPDVVFTEPGRDPIELLVREGFKPERPPEGPLVRLVVHASAAFSIAHLEHDETSIGAALVDALRAHPGLADMKVRWSRAHRWRFARVRTPLGRPCLFDAARGVGVAGDGMLGPRIEAAWESGRALADEVLPRDLSATR